MIDRPSHIEVEQGAFVEVRGKPWLVEALLGDDGDLPTLSLSCISDDAQGERLDVLWDAEIAGRVLDEDRWSNVGVGRPDSADVLAAHIRAIRWRSATAADRDLLQAPFRAGIRLDAYQLLPLRKALRLPRVNLLIADDVGLGKTIEAGLVARELLLRRRVDFIVIAAPPAMTVQWKDELEAKFGLSFEIIDRDRISELRRLRGFSINPWTTGSRFIVSHRLLTDETYSAGLRDVLGEFRARALFILDEAHHAAPSAGTRYAVSSQLTKAVRELAERFEHRLFLTATPHNGHSNSFSALLEMLDPQRFTRGVEVRPRDLEPVMVRRLKADLRRLGEAFPERVVEPISIDGLPEDAPELALARLLAAYGELRMKRIAKLSSQKAALAKLHAREIARDRDMAEALAQAFRQRLNAFGVRLHHAGLALDPASQLRRQRAGNRHAVNGDEIAFGQRCRIHRLSHLQLVPVAAFWHRDAELAAVLGNRYVGDADLLGEALHRFRPDEVVKLFTRQGEGHRSLQAVPCHQAQCRSRARRSLEVAIADASCYRR